MYIPVPNLLNTAELAQIDNILSIGKFTSGKITATGAAKEVKNNEQLAREDQQTAFINQIIEQALMQSPIFREATQTKAVLPFLISRYLPGMEYGWHVDSPLSGANNMMIRADMSITIFLTGPDEYEGGELEIETESETRLFKMNKGDAIIYPTTKIHRVKPVTQGTRVVAVSWIQSLIKNTEQRDLLFQMKSLEQMLSQQQQGSPIHLLAQQINSNLLRMFIEM